MRRGIGLAHRAPFARGASSGQSATEFAMVLPLALLILFGIVEFGLVIHGYSFASNSARDAVRYAIVHGATSTNPATATDIQNLVYAEAQGVDTSKLTVNTTWTPSNQPGNKVKVQVTYAFEPLYPISTMSFSLTGMSQMIISQ